MGGSKTQVIQPTAPPAPSMQTSLSDYVSSLPQLFQAQLDFAPREAAQQVALMQQYAQPLGQAMRDAQRTVNPEITALQDQLSAQALSGATGGIPEDLKQQYADQFRALVGDQVSSGLGADFVAKNLMQQDLAFRQFNQNLGLSLAGMQPVAQPFAPNITNQLQGINAGQALGYTSGNYGAQLGFSRPFMMPGRESQVPQYISSIGSLFRGAGDLKTAFK